MPSQTASQFELLRIAEVAALLRCSKITIRRLVHAGDLTAFRLTDGGPWLFRREDVLRRLAPVPVTSSPSSTGSSARTPPTAVEWVSGLTGSPPQKAPVHGS